MLNCLVHKQQKREKKFITNHITLKSLLAVSISYFIWFMKRQQILFMSGSFTNPTPQ